MLRALGFGGDWVNLLMLCVNSVSYSILVNGEVAGQVRPTRGIRHGDPLSPYLFIICAEGFSTLLQMAEACRDIHGVRVARGAPAITHLFFADDSLLFFKASEREALKVKECLDVYSRASGQLINFEKSSAVYSSNTPSHVRAVVSELIGVPEAADLGRYLGLPSMLGRNKTAVFRYIESNVRARIGMWQNKLLSRAGKEVLLKSIAQALPIFTMSVFLLPMRVCDTLEKLYNRFWWGGGGQDRRGIHWLSWGRMCIPKSRGGLGFKKLHEFTMALLAKQGWRILINPESLVSRLLKARYFPTKDFMDAQLGCNPSFIWRSIHAGRKVLDLGVTRRVGDGMDTKIWGRGWLAGDSHVNLRTPCVEYLQDARVHGLLDGQGQWDLSILRDIFLEEDVPKILATPVSSQFRDSWRWVGDVRGCYTVKNGYRRLTEEASSQNTADGFQAWNALWSAPIPPKVKNFLWRCALNILPVRDNLRIKMGSKNVLQGRNFFEFLSTVIGNATVDVVMHAAAVLWIVWSTRNDVVWKAVFGAGASFGIVVRDHGRRFIAAKSGWLNDVDDPYMAEAIGVREALTWLKAQDHSVIILESDCLNFCTAFNSVISDFSYVGLVVKQCVSIARDMGSVKVSHVKRSANRVAHALARVTVSLSDSGVWYGIPPICIENVLTQE
ncbi:PREDICTED: uncharacterized protein LOC109147128 [Ipomoea nil]|uniref:uncharacterized protein LOC109147128 n=1 Tax=Ipomoea nil TaxID=35883 RepID=UPI000900D5BB|nr:PREDICTED: uncharacterized protein LOC109147128 [Ipomoea nil]